MDCEYSDGINPTRTELLEERLSRLQERLESMSGSLGTDATDAVLPMAPTPDSKVTLQLQRHAPGVGRRREN